MQVRHNTGREMQKNVAFVAVAIFAVLWLSRTDDG